jgi:hypothetical protein
MRVAVYVRVSTLLHRHRRRPLRSNWNGVARRDGAASAARSSFSTTRGGATRMISCGSPIRGAVAEYERTLIAERMRRGRQRKLRAGGLSAFPRLPYGYRTDPDRPRDAAGVRLEPAQAAVVAELFARYSEEGVSLVRLALGLSAQGTPTPRGHWRLPSDHIARHLEQPYPGSLKPPSSRSASSWSFSSTGWSSPTPRWRSAT